MPRIKKTTTATTAVLCLTALTIHMMPSVSLAQDAPEQPVSATSMVSPYESFCAACHDNRSEESLAPSRQAMREMDPERVFAALTEGPMAAFATTYG
ncbi:MAG: c-type cytochrome, partial [Planctomycetota bacterium]